MSPSSPERGPPPRGLNRADSCCPARRNATPTVGTHTARSPAGGCGHPHRYRWHRCDHHRPGLPPHPVVPDVSRRPPLRRVARCFRASDLGTAARHRHSQPVDPADRRRRGEGGSGAGRAMGFDGARGTARHRRRARRGSDGRGPTRNRLGAGPGGGRGSVHGVLPTRCGRQCHAPHWQRRGRHLSRRPDHADCECGPGPGCAGRSRADRRVCFWPVSASGPWHSGCSDDR